LYTQTRMYETIDKTVGSPCAFLGAGGWEKARQ